MINQEHIKALYDCYVTATKLDLKLTMGLTFQLERFAVEGFTCDDVNLVVAYLWRRIKAGKRQKECLLPRNLIVNTDEFAENLSMARSESRSLQTKPDPRKESVLKATGRSAEVTSDTKSAQQILEQNKLMASMLSKWKEENL